MSGQGRPRFRCAREVGDGVLGESETQCWCGCGRAGALDHGLCHSVELQACGLVKQRSVIGQRSRVCYHAVAALPARRLRRGSGTKGERAGGHAGGWSGSAGRGSRQSQKPAGVGDGVARAEDNTSMRER